MSSIAARKFVASIVKNGKTIDLYAATQTAAWRRTDDQALEVGNVLKSTLEANPDLVPANTKEITLRSVILHLKLSMTNHDNSESEHKSAADPRSHLTVVCKEDNDNEKTRHIAT